MTLFRNSCQALFCQALLGPALLILALALPSAALDAAEGYRPPGKADKCPVCGMFVYKYPDWVAAMRFADGRMLYFDGAKDMLRHLLTLSPDEKSRIADLFVTEYYGLQIMDARKALYVTGSDVYGPMGRELIPFKTRAEAEEFSRDHNGKLIISFTDITPAIIENIDNP